MYLGKVRDELHDVIKSKQITFGCSVTQSALWLRRSKSYWSLLFGILFVSLIEENHSRLFRVDHSTCTLEHFHTDLNVQGDSVEVGIERESNSFQDRIGSLSVRLEEARLTEHSFRCQ